MPAYVITQDDKTVPDAGCVVVDKLNGHRGVAVFTDRQSAEQCAQQEGVEGCHHVSALDSLQLLRLVVAAYEKGIHYLVLNPVTRPGRPARGPVVVIEEKLASFAESLTRDVLAMKLRARGSAPATPAEAETSDRCETTTVRRQMKTPVKTR